ncbi:MAG: hypothetical protein K8S25_12795, partial [Alphaproteobacteria bacterium]|nr:hypothetical protein [Alphaproteobacteria bacterium]
MRMKLQAIALCLVLPVVAGCSYFGSDKPEREVSARPVGKLTTDCARLQPLFGPDDQELTRDAMDAGLKTELTKWDKSGDGELSNSEVGPLNDALREENVGASPVTDWNGDGHVDFQEFAAGWRTMFELCDRNRSKTVSLRELGHSPHVTPGVVTAPSAPKKPPEG